MAGKDSTLPCARRRPAAFNAFKTRLVVDAPNGRRRGRKLPGGSMTGGLRSPSRPLRQQRVFCRGYCATTGLEPLKA
jgi:hypothetical protein